MYPAELADKLTGKNIPISASFELTYLCNERCIHCYQPTHQKINGELSTEKVKDILDQLAEAGCLYLSFTGGEPMLRKDFWQIAEYAYERSFALQLQTNGTLLTPEAIKILKRLNFFQVHISLLGSRASTHDTITRYPGSFDRVINATRLLREKGVTVILKVTLLKENIHELDEIVELSKQLGTYHTLSPIIFPGTAGKKDPLMHRVSDLELRKIYSLDAPIDMQDMDDFFSRYNPDDNSPPCQMGRNDCCINPYGLVYPCVAVPIVLGNLKKERFIDIWTKSGKLKQLRSLTLKDFKGCLGCKLSNLCIRCPGLSYLEHGDIVSVPEEMCRVSRAIKEVM